MSRPHLPPIEYRVTGRWGLAVGSGTLAEGLAGIALEAMQLFDQGGPGPSLIRSEPRHW